MTLRLGTGDGARSYVLLRPVAGHPRNRDTRPSFLLRPQDEKDRLVNVEFEDGSRLPEVNDVVMHGVPVPRE